MAKLLSSRSLSLRTWTLVFGLVQGGCVLGLAACTGDDAPGDAVDGGDEASVTSDGGRNDATATADGGTTADARAEAAADAGTDARTDATTADSGSDATVADSGTDGATTSDASDSGSTSDASDSGTTTDASDSGTTTDASDSGASGDASDSDASDSGTTSDASDSGSSSDASDDAASDASDAAALVRYCSEYALTSGDEPYEIAVGYQAAVNDPAQYCEVAGRWEGTRGNGPAEDTFTACAGLLLGETFGCAGWAYPPGAKNILDEDCNGMLLFPNVGNAGITNAEFNVAVTAFRAFLVNSGSYTAAKIDLLVSNFESLRARAVNMSAPTNFPQSRCPE
ncbi:MAG: hypothetical protein U0169_25470 [Polyangiaceae bacterium]